MRCRTCDYPLWNLPARACPECGQPFRPGEFEFVPNAVRFACPHCAQVYYGTDPNGHLVPRRFECVQCGRAIDMDEMVLCPAEGVTDERTGRRGAPWLERRERGWWRCWLATVGRSLVAPRDLMSGLPPGRVGQAWRFAAITIGLTMAASVGVALPFMAGMALWMGSIMPSGGPPGWVMAASMGTAVVISMAAVAILTLLWIGAWAPLTHWILKRTGPVEGTIGRTYQAICYSSGAFVTTATPCLGQYVGGVWWIVSAVLAVQKAHRTSGGRATFAVLTPPAVLVMLLAGAYATFFGFMVAFSSRTAVGQQAAISSTRIVLNAVQASASANNGVGPDHALELVGNGRPLVVSDLVDRSTLTDTARVPAGGGTLDNYMLLSADAQATIAEEAGLILPGNVIAHRVGDFVFTYHGMDLSKWSPGLWVVVMSPDPGADPGSAPFVVVGGSDGTVTRVRARDFPMKLQWQNGMRGRAGLPPLPDPATVTHDKPAVATDPEP